MSRLGRRVAAVTSIAAASAAFVVATPKEVSSEANTNTCIAFDNSPAWYDTGQGSESLKIDYLAGRMIGYIATRCEQPAPGEVVTMRALGYGTFELVLRRHTEGDGTPENMGGDYYMSATTVLTPNKKLSRSGATHIGIGTSAITLRADAIMPVTLYDMNANVDLGSWSASVEATGDGPFYGDSTPDSGSTDSVVEIANHIITDEMDGAAILPPRRG